MAAINNEVPQFEVYKERLIDEVAKGNLVMIKALAKKNPKLLNVVDKDECTILHLAACWSQLNVIEWLLSDEGRAAGFNSVLKRAKGNVVALLLASRNGDLECFKAIVYGCKVENGERKEMLNTADRNGFTVLHIATVKGKPAIIKWLLSDKKGGGRQAGFSCVLATEREKGWTALHRAAAHGDLECFTAIVEGCKVENGERKRMLNAVNHEDQICLHYAYECRTVLHLAAEQGHMSIIKWLLSKGPQNGFVSLLSDDDHGITALHIAAEKGHLEICQAIVAACPTADRKKLLNATDGSAFTALHVAAMGGHTSVVTWLLSDKQGGGRTMGFKKVLAKVNNGDTALHMAAREGHLETCKAILDGCKVENGEKKKMMNAVDDNDNTVLHNATRKGRTDIVTWLLSHDADGGRANGLSSDRITADTIFSQTALHLVAASGSVETLRALLSGCTAEERLTLFRTIDDVREWTPLHWATVHQRVDMIRELLLHHPETQMIVDHRDEHGMTALHRVILDGGFDEDSKREWKLYRHPDVQDRAPREEVVAALLTFEFDDDDEEEGGKAQAASSTKKEDKKKKQQQQQKQQAAFFDINLGLKIEKKEE